MTYEDMTLLCELLFEILKHFKAAKFSHLIKILDYEKEIAYIKNMKIHILGIQTLNFIFLNELLASWQC